MGHESEVVPGLGEAILYRRELKRLTQQELADRLKVTNVYVCNLERGAKTPSIPLLVELAAELDTSLSQLFADAARLAEERARDARKGKGAG